MTKSARARRLARIRREMRARQEGVVVTPLAAMFAFSLTAFLEYLSREPPAPAPKPTREEDAIDRILGIKSEARAKEKPN